MYQEHKTQERKEEPKKSKNNLRFVDVKVSHQNTPARDDNVSRP